MTHKCWYCGVEPDGTVDVMILGSATPVQVIPTGWPASDHQHAFVPPTPAELVNEGHRLLRRILEEL